MGTKFMKLRTIRYLIFGINLVFSIAFAEDIAITNSCMDLGNLYLLPKVSKTVARFDAGTVHLQIKVGTKYRVVSDKDGKISTRGSFVAEPHKDYILTANSPGPAYCRIRLSAASDTESVGSSVV